MSAAVLKGLLALVAACVFFGISSVLFLTHPNLASTLFALGNICFGVLMLMLAFEALDIFPTLGWGQPRSLGSYIDLIVTVSGVALIVAGLFSRSVA